MSEKPTYEELEQALKQYESDARNAVRLRKVEESLRYSEAKYRRLVESLDRDYVIYSHDPQGLFTYLSPSIFNVLGYTQEEFAGHYAEYMTDSPINARVEEYTLAALRGEKQLPYEAEFLHKNGTCRRLSVTEVPIVDDQGNVLEIEGIVHDITEQKKAEEEREELIDRLHQALCKSKAQGTLLPMCAACKKVKDGNDRWQHIEVYVMEHTDLGFTHGYCPECYETLMESVPPRNKEGAPDALRSSPPSL
ncbi:MAG: PAS domain S-box protein [Pontiellaceae bacterium]|nr:PAS domain S-box protein [Pontiellaceae bacterium]MBN2784383.1 PAS domain S-box protein [Pontiellaceae bacterium]